MPLTITADSVHELRAHFNDLFPALAVGSEHSAESIETWRAESMLLNEIALLVDYHGDDSAPIPGLVRQRLAATAPLTQAPGPDAKELIEARATITKLESAYSAQADVLRETQAKLTAANDAPVAVITPGDYPDMLAAIAEACDVLGSPRDPVALPALVAEVKQERDQARQALQEAQETLESTGKEIKRLQDLVGTPGDPVTAPKRTRKPKDAAADVVTPEPTDAAPQEAQQPAPTADTVRRYPDEFLALPKATLEAGAAVVALVEGEAGWSMSSGTIARHYASTDKYEVALASGGMAVVSEVRLRGHAATVERAPVAPLALITEADQLALRDYARELDLKPEAVKAMIARLFAPKTASGELTTDELAKLRAEMALDAVVPF